MRQNIKQKLKNSRLYAITTSEMFSQDYEKMIEDACLAGIDILQFRDENLPQRSDKEKLKIIKKIRKITSKYNVIFIVNNRIDLAILGKADGVHLGQNDISIKEARKITNLIIGKSTHSLEQAKLAEKEGADYLGIGPVIQTPTKPTYIPIGAEIAKKVQQTIKIPAFVIGGIDEKNIQNFVDFGLNRFAIVRAIFSSDNIKENVKFLDKILKRY